jgi:hypothetical protein
VANWWDLHWFDECTALIAADPDWYVKYVATEAARGNPYPLIARLGKPPTLSDVEFTSVVAALRPTANKETKAYLRRLERELIAIAVDRMIDEDGLTQKQAIAAVRQGRGRSTSYIKNAIADHGIKRYYPRSSSKSPNF